MSSSTLSTPKQKSLYLASSLRDGLEDNDLKQVTTLLKNKEADPNVLMPFHGVTPFHLVIGNDSEIFAEEVTKLFLRHGGNPNVKSVDGMTPVHVAAAWGRIRILKLLLANGGDPLCIDADNCTPFNYALQGEHFEAVSLLSKYCMNKGEEDEKPKFKRELDKVLVNNGEVLAEYIVSDDTSKNTSFESFCSTSIFSNNETKNIKTNTSGYAPENSLSDAASLNNDYITVRKKKRKHIIEKCTDSANSNFDEPFLNKTDEEEINLINEIISQLSSSVSSEKDVNVIFQNYENEFSYRSESSNKCKTSSPKKIQMSMTFNRPVKDFESSKFSENQVNKKRQSTLQVIKHHNNLPHIKNNKVLSDDFKKSSIISEKNFLIKNSFQSSSKKVDAIKLKTKSPVRENKLYNWLDETIISKSPNLEINVHSEKRKNKLLKTPVFEKKSSPIYSNGSKKINIVTPTTVKSQKQIYNHKTPVSRIPKPKKYFVTPCSTKAMRRNMKTPTNTDTPSREKNGSLKKTNSNQKSRHVTPLNSTYSKSETSTPTLSGLSRKSRLSTNRIESFKDIAVNLHNRMSNRDEEDIFKESCNTNHSEKLITTNDFISGIEKLPSTSFKLDSKSEHLIDIKEKNLNVEEMDVDLGRELFHCIPNKELADKNTAVESPRFEKTHKKNYNGFDSLKCEKGSVLSDSSDSFISLRLTDHSDNDLDNKNGLDCKFSPSPDNFISLSDNASTCSRRYDFETGVGVQEEYKYEDPEEGVVFLERRLCVSPSCVTSDLDSSFYSCYTAKSEPLPKEMLVLDHATLRERLRNLGENPGPITKTTHHLYLKRLHRLESQNKKCNQNNIPNLQLKTDINITNLYKEKCMLKASLVSIDWIKDLDDYEAIEHKVFQEFVTPNPSRKWREGTTKNSFNYLLLDPRITEDLPRRAPNLSLSEKWQTFLEAIFYVGKGKRSRPYEHLYEAFKIWVSQDRRKATNKKTERILNIWNAGKGVVVLHVFQNTIPVDAYTRESIMIEVLGKEKLGNIKSGDSYGLVSTMKPKERFELGRYLLFKALQILLLEGERQIFPENL